MLENPETTADPWKLFHCHLFDPNNKQHLPSNCFSIYGKTYHSIEMGTLVNLVSAMTIAISLAKILARNYPYGYASQVSLKNPTREEGVIFTYQTVSEKFNNHNDFLLRAPNREFYLIKPTKQSSSISITDQKSDRRFSLALPEPLLDALKNSLEKRQLTMLGKKLKLSDEINILLRQALDQPVKISQSK